MSKKKVEVISAASQELEPAVSFEEIKEAFERGYAAEAKAVAALPKIFKKGEGVVDVPFDDVD